MSDELILNADQAQAMLEIDMDSPATKQDVANFVTNYHQKSLEPLLAELLKAQNMLFDKIKVLEARAAAVELQADRCAVSFNTLMDFLNIPDNAPKKFN